MIMTMDEIKEFLALKKELFGDNLFVENDTQDPKWIRYNELAGKYQNLMAWI